MDMSLTLSNSAGGQGEGAATKGNAYACVGDAREITRPRHSPKTSSATSKTLQMGLEIRAGRGHPIMHRVITPPRLSTPLDSEASLCQPPIFVVCAGASEGASGVAEVGVVGLVVGSGSDLSEEPAVQDVEPVTLDFEPCLIVLPGPLDHPSSRRASATSER